MSPMVVSACRFHSPIWMESIVLGSSHALLHALLAACRSCLISLWTTNEQVLRLPTDLSPFSIWLASRTYH